MAGKADHAPMFRMKSAWFVDAMSPPLTAMSTTMFPLMIPPMPPVFSLCCVGGLTNHPDEGNL